MKNKKFLGLAVFFPLCFFILSSAWAVELPSINKSKIRFFIPPGEAGYGEIIIENNTSETRSMRAYLEDWRYLPAADGTKEFLPANATSTSAASWISFSPSEFTLTPFSRQKVNYSVKVPAEANGGHFAALFFESVFGKLESQQKEFKAGMNIVIRIATLFYIEPQGSIKRSAEIDNLVFKPDQKSGIFSIELDFKNTGNSDITCAGTFNIIDKEGMVFARGEFNDAYTFSGNRAKLTATCKDNIPKGKYDLVLTFNLGKALEEDDSGHGPVVTKEAEIEIRDSGSAVALGKLE